MPRQQAVYAACRDDEVIARYSILRRLFLTFHYAAHDIDFPPGHRPRASRLPATTEMPGRMPRVHY